jgi:hypothetical protein
VKKGSVYFNKSNIPRLRSQPKLDNNKFKKKEGRSEMVHERKRRRKKMAVFGIIKVAFLSFKKK